MRLSDFETVSLWPARRLLLGLGLLVLAVNLVGIWGLVYSGREAREEALKDLELQTIAAARSLETVLASARADLYFLSQSPPLSDFRRALHSENPLSQRWSRLDIEATLLLFLSSHPEVERLYLGTEAEGIFMIVGRRDGVPLVLSTEQEAVPKSDGLSGRWPLGEADTAWMEARLSIESLLNLLGAAQEYELILHSLEEMTSLEDDMVVETVQDPNWDPPVRWTLVRSDSRAGLIESLGRLTDRYRITLIVNLLLMFLAVVLGALSFGQIRRRTALEFENRQQARIRELERQLLHSERLASVGRMAAGMAHEINNPLEGMGNYLALLEDDLKRGELTSARECAVKIREGLRRTAGVTRRALSLSEPGHKPNARVDLRKVILETVDFVRSNKLFRGIEIETTGLDREIPLLGNPVTLSQALLNLLLNAGEILQGRGRIEIDAVIDDGQVVLSIADDGPGIDEELLERVFEPFASGRDSTGLGLSICRTIVERHSGEISVRNRDRGGAEFRLLFPLFDSKDEESGEPPKAVERWRREKGRAPILEASRRSHNG